MELVRKSYFVISYGATSQKACIVMELVGSTAFISAMDRPIVRRRFKRPMLVGVVMSVTALAAIAWLVLHPAERTLNVEARKITISSVAAAPFHDFIPLRGQLVPLDSIVL